MSYRRIKKNIYKEYHRVTVGDSVPSYIHDNGKELRMNDFYLAVTIFHTGARLLSVDIEDSERRIYVFSRICNIDDSADKFYSDQFDVKALSFLESIKDFEKLVELKIIKNNNKQ